MFIVVHSITNSHEKLYMDIWDFNRAISSLQDDFLKSLYEEYIGKLNL